MLALTAHPEVRQVPSFIVTGEELIGNTITDIPKLIDPIFPSVGVIAIAGSSDTGKSSLLRQLAMEIVSGKDAFLGFPIKAIHNSVLYVSTEDDFYALSSLMKIQNVERKAPSTYSGLRFIFNSTNILGKIEAELKRKPVDAVIIDAFADLYGGDMNRTNEVRNYLQKFTDLAIQFKCLFIFLHHTSKRTEENPPSKHNMIGSQGFEAKMRLVVELRKDFQNPSSGKRHFCIVKGNYLADSYKNSSYELTFTSNLVFETTGRRIPFEKLAPQDGRRTNVEARDRARELHSEGKTIVEIHEIMTEEGYTAARSTIGNYVLNH